ncbi:MAG: DUF2484 family protein [Paracoccaceae bacterium]|jgi:hypothetical protein
MSYSILFAAIWVLLATGVAMLPMRRQYVPGVALLVAAPMLIIWLGFEQGWIIALAATFGFLSMFRNPLRYFWKKWRGTLPETSTDNEGTKA